MTGSRQVPVGQLERLYAGCAAHFGSAPADAVKFAHCIAQGDLRHDTQGVSLFAEFIWPQMASGAIRFTRTRDFEFLSLGVVCVDAARTAGQIVVTDVMDHVLQIAKAQGVGMGLVRNAGDIGMASAYAMQALARNAIGIVVVRGDHPLVAPWGSRDGLFGTNPIAVAIPALRFDPIVIDMSPAVFSVGTLVETVRTGLKGDTVSVVDREGLYGADPSVIVMDPDCREPRLDGAILPIGAKGSALLVLTEILGGILAGAFDQAARDSVLEFPTSVCLIAISIDAVMPSSQFRHRIDALIESVLSTRPAEGFAEVLLPGMRAARLERHRRQAGIEIGLKHWRLLQEIARVTGQFWPLD